MIRRIMRISILAVSRDLPKITKTGVTQLVHPGGRGAQTLNICKRVKGGALRKVKCGCCCRS